MPQSIWELLLDPTRYLVTGILLPNDTETPSIATAATAAFIDSNAFLSL